MVLFDVLAIISLRALFLFNALQTSCPITKVFGSCPICLQTWSFASSITPTGSELSSENLLVPDSDDLLLKA